MRNALPCIHVPAALTSIVEGISFLRKMKVSLFYKIVDTFWIHYCKIQGLNPQLSPLHKPFALCSISPQLLSCLFAYSILLSWQEWTSPQIPSHLLFIILGMVKRLLFCKAPSTCPTKRLLSPFCAPPCSVQLSFFTPSLIIFNLSAHLAISSTRPTAT